MLHRSRRGIVRVLSIIQKPVRNFNAENHTQNTSTMATKRVMNFAPGPAALPDKVLQRAQSEMLNYNDLGYGVMEMSHRSAEFVRIQSKAEQDLRDLINIPDNYKILFLQGGGSGQFAGVPLNLMRDGAADYFVTGSWSAKAIKEGEKYGKCKPVFPKPDKFTTIPSKEDWKLTQGASYIYYCDNETIHGVEFQEVPESNGVPIVCDMSSNFLSRPFDITKYGVVYAGAQKNIGCAGVTIVIVREDLIGFASGYCPAVLDYKTQFAMNSCYNTPPTYSIYICGLVLEWLKENGGVESMYELSKTKSSMIYDVIDQSKGFYCAPVDKAYRSRMNIPFRIGSPEGVEELEKKFLAEAAALDMISLKGHRSVGGIRASLYNATTVETTNKLADFMRDFQTRNN
ncbi:phosphoserine aminotransferase-like [Amphiura filiformis]|uniref:phosphoserine aminotransferase-like n=1 Tax=Amphiura filiformis TaxID=82378 RepID=UPI003B22037D